MKLLPALILATATATTLFSTTQARADEVVPPTTAKSIPQDLRINNSGINDRQATDRIKPKFQPATPTSTTVNPQIYQLWDAPVDWLQTQRIASSK